MEWRRELFDRKLIRLFVPHTFSGSALEPKQRRVILILLYANEGPFPWYDTPSGRNLYSSPVYLGRILEAEGDP